MFKKVFLTISILSLVLIAVVALSSKSLVNADDRFHPHGNNHNSRGYNPDNNLSKSACGSHLGKPVVDNVTVKVQNDADSGVTGNYWAFDYYTKTINAWQTAGNTYCVIVAYNDFMRFPDK